MNSSIPPREDSIRSAIQNARAKHDVDHGILGADYDLRSCANITILFRKPFSDTIAARRRLAGKASNCLPEETLRGGVLMVSRKIFGSVVDARKNKKGSLQKADWAPASIDRAPWRTYPARQRIIQATFDRLISELEAKGRLEWPTMREFVGCAVIADWPRCDRPIPVPGSGAFQGQGATVSSMCPAWMSLGEKVWASLGAASIRKPPAANRPSLFHPASKNEKPLN